MSVQETVQNIPTPRPVRPLAAALWEEFTAIHGKPAGHPASGGPEAELAAYYAAARAQNQSALCLSGGGIRSASFSLGVLQALASKGLLTQFHYLSSVSGGGYIAGWLTELIHDHEGDVGRVQELLGQPVAPAALGALRRYTNFLTPEPGLASADTWAGVLLWVRNTLVNWLLFLPAMFAAAQLPMLYADVVQSVGVRTGWPLLLAGLACLGFGVYNGATHLPSHAPPSDPVRCPPGRTARFVRWGVVLPILIWAGLAPLVAAPSLRQVLEPGTLPVALIPLGSFAAMLLGYLLAGWQMGGEDGWLFNRNLGWWILSCLVASAVLAAGTGFAPGLSPLWLAVLGPVWVTAAHLLQSLVFVALRREAFRGELDREWLARLNALKVVPALLWGVFAATCLLLPAWLLSGAAVQWATGVAGLLTGPGAALLGRFSRSSPTGEGEAAGGSGRTDLIVACAAVLFGTVIFLLLAAAGRFLADAFAEPGAAGLPAWRLPVDAGLIVIAGGLSWWLGGRININRFSLHAVYRNRLVRAFLGSARSSRAPDGFTGLDPEDNLRMSQAFLRSGRRSLFPVVNVALNLTAVHNPAWAERKAESFTITPLGCGAAFLHRREDVQACKPVRGAYVDTARYAGAGRETGKHDSGSGLTLGTALTLSGAAVSPSMGYNSSAPVAFLMTLFNFRLGAWLPNPAIAEAGELLQARPPNALKTIGLELLGLSDDRGEAVYLSDGGHFEVIGLYEMVRRRCRHILVIDAGEDPRAEFGDLGNTVRKIAIDFNVRIRFRPPMAIGSRTHPILPVRWFAWADIEYPEGWTGQLIYLKPCTLPDPPIDVRAYAAAHADFPHESTLDQWFSESQFESYRRLGEAETSQLGAVSYAECLESPLAAFFDDVRAQINAVSATECCPVEQDKQGQGAALDPQGVSGPLDPVP
jgi:hypothetical protein